MDILESDDEVDVNFQVNKDFAKKFERQQLKLDLQRNKHKLENIDNLDDEGDESDSETEDESAELLDKSLELQIVRTINMIRSKDPKIYDPNNKWFPDNDDSVSDGDYDDSDNDSKNKKEKKVVMNDVLRNQLLSNQNDDDADDNDDPALRRKELQITKSKHILAYDKEQEQLRQSFLSLSNNNNANEDDESEDDLLQVKIKSKEQLDEENKLLLEELKKFKRKNENIDNNTESNTDRNTDDFLYDYITKEKWKDNNNTLDIQSDISDDEKHVELTDLFESKYNFRYEELENSMNDGLKDIQIVGHDRNIQGIVRKTDDKRKISREQLKERKEKEKRIKEEEMKRLKNLKKKELQERLRKISEIGGLNELNIDESALDEDWNPEKHEELMQQQFGSSYYDTIDEEFNAEDENDLTEMLYNDDLNDDDNINEDLSNQSINRLVKKSNDEKSKNILDELYQLDYEDIVAGIPCRFKYKSVEPESYGLSIEDILLAKDSELNQIISLKKLSPYNTYKMNMEEKKRILKRRKRLHLSIKERIKLGGLVDNDDLNEEKHKKKRKRSKKGKGDSAIDIEIDSKDDNEIDNKDFEIDSTLKKDIDNKVSKKAKVRKHKKDNNKDTKNTSRLDLYN